MELLTNTLYSRLAVHTNNALRTTTHTGSSLQYITEDMTKESSISVTCTETIFSDDIVKSNQTLNKSSQFDAKERDMRTSGSTCKLIMFRGM